VIEIENAVVIPISEGTVVQKDTRLRD